MENMNDKPEKTQRITPLQAHDGTPELHVDGIQGVMVRDGMVRMRLFSDMLVTDGKEPFARTLVARVNMTVPSLLRMQEFINALVVQMENDGIVVSSEIEGED